MRSAKLFAPESLLILPVFALGLAMFISVLIDLRTAVKTGGRHLQAPGERVQAILFCLIGLTALVFMMNLRTVPGGTETLAVAWPVQGKWRTVQGGRFTFLNAHHGRPRSQNFAVDLVKGGGSSLGEPVLAPVAGTIIRAVNDHRQGDDSAEGNVVVIRTADEFVITLAHLEEGSVGVSENETIRAGERVGRCGQSGSATSPHLHIHAQRGVDPVALKFGPNKRFLIRGDSYDGR
jgi:murein DD-endopeptidase MepM/ murein hydrolase activator NlpD